jgi:hypothetical protein
MPWFYVDDGFSDSKPVLNMPDRHRLAACGLWVLAGSWSAKEELDGFVPNSKLRQLGARPTIISALTENGPMFAPLCVKTSAGIQFNSWEKWQKTRAELAEKRREDAERQRVWRAAHPEAKPMTKTKGRNTVTSIYTDKSQRDTSVTDTVTNNVTEPVSDDVSQCDLARAGARPDPTRPDPIDTTTANAVVVPRKRGTRLTPNWMPSQAVRDAMKAECPTVDFHAEHRKFIDYWTDKTGKDATKVSWDGTWRNWIRRAAEQTPSRQTANTNGQGQLSTMDDKVNRWMNMPIPDDPKELPCPE